MAEEDVYFGVEVARGLVKWKDLAVGLRLRSALRLQEREIARRRWAFEEVPPRLVVANEEDDRQLFEESFAILLNRGSLGIVVGLASDDYERPQVSGFVELTWYLGRD